MAIATPIFLEQTSIGVGDGDGSGSDAIVPQNEEEAVTQECDQDRASSGQSLTIPVAAEEQQDYSEEDCSTRAGSLTDEAGEARTSGSTTTSAGTANGVPPSGESDSALAEVDDLAVSRAVPSTERGSLPATWPAHHHDLRPVGFGGDSGIAARVKPPLLHLCFLTVEKLKS